MCVYCFYCEINLNVNLKDSLDWNRDTLKLNLILTLPNSENNKLEIKKELRILIKPFKQSQSLEQISDRLP